jgi:hypothetical protein
MCYLVSSKCICGGTQWRSWLRHCTTSRKAGGSIPDGFIGILHWHKPYGRTMALGLIQPLKKWVPGIFPGVKWGVYGWQPYHLHVSIVLKSGSLKLLESSGPAQACNRFALLLPKCICASGLFAAAFLTCFTKHQTKEVGAFTTPLRSQNCAFSHDSLWKIRWDYIYAWPNFKKNILNRKEILKYLWVSL